ncbi:MAG: hypothetical protein K2Y17_13450 [Qipengyuania sp.]|jgi:hypothetical protein|nr:hypothetical protein [Qipengyuania sp.]
MKFRTLAATAAAISMVAVPVVAADRAAAPVSNESEMGGSWLLAILAAAAIIAGIVIAVDSGKDRPVSA